MHERLATLILLAAFFVGTLAALGFLDRVSYRITPALRRSTSAFLCVVLGLWILFVFVASCAITIGAAYLARYWVVTGNLP